MTELIWDGKYDENGRKVAPPRIALPFQTVETVNESAQDRQRALDLFGGQDKEWRNRLIWGDKKYVLPSLLPELAGKVNLIYIDPPFDTGADFSFTTTIPDSDTSFVKEPSVIEQKAYRDTWGKGLDSYLKWFYETVIILRDLLSDNGSLYVHLDYHVSHYAKAVADEVFGSENFINEISWRRTTTKNDYQQGAVNWPRIRDVILYYRKDAKQAGTFIQQFGPYSDEYTATKYRYKDHNGRTYRLDNLTAPGAGTRGHPTYEFMGVTRYWRYNREKMETLLQEGKIVQTRPGTVPQIKRYLDEVSGIAIGDTWDDIAPLNSQADERLGYPTQKPEALLERILKANSRESDLILDCFCGSGTTASVAEKLGRRWITCDLGRFAIHTARKRLLGIEGVKPFTVQNLGKYERQAWQAAEFGDQADARTQAYRTFILNLYKARPLSGYLWLHGVRNGRLVHVGSVDSPISVGDVTQIALEFRRAAGSGPDAPTQNGVDVLGWDFAFEVNEVARQQAALANIALRFVRIPREVLEKKAVDQGDIRFFELAALAVEAQTSGKSVTLKLTDFTIPVDDVPEDVQRAISHWSQWIDYWAVDWDNRSDAFHNQWQAYRTRKEKSLQRQIAHTYEASGEYRVVVKVIDILGNDTTKTLTVEVA